jgi:hypothetical protein
MQAVCASITKGRPLPHAFAIEGNHAGAETIGSQLLRIE